MRQYSLIKDMPVDERPREKMQNSGRKKLSNEELIAIILRTGGRGKSVTDLAKQVLSISENGIGYLGDCTIEELTALQGIGESKACQVLAAIELGTRVSQHTSNKLGKITTPEDVFNHFRHDLLFEKRERFIIALMNTKNEITSKELISIGSINSSIVHPREVFSIAIRKSAASIILVHNHPSGDPTPSYEDIKVTERLKEVGDLVGIKVIDHIVIGDKRYYSFKEQNMI